VGIRAKIWVAVSFQHECKFKFVTVDNYSHFDTATKLKYLVNLFTNQNPIHGKITIKLNSDVFTDVPFLYATCGATVEQRPMTDEDKWVCKDENELERMSTVVSPKQEC
jgi:hypothetical protein